MDVTGYLLSNEYRHDEVHNRLGQLRLQAADKQGIAPEEVEMSNMEAFLVQDGPYIDASYEEMVDEFGSIDGYIREGLGLTEAERAISQMLFVLFLED